MLGGFPNIMGLFASAFAEQAMLAPLLRGTPRFPHRSRGDRAHKRWKRGRASGRH